MVCNQAERGTGERRKGERWSGEKRTGERRNGERWSGEKRTGERRNGESEVINGRTVME